MRIFRRVLAATAAVVALGLAVPAAAQQRPLLTEDPEPIGAGRILIEGGLEVSHDQPYPATGLKGNLLRAPAIGVSVGISSIAELQIDGVGFNRLTIHERIPAPLSADVAVTGIHTHSAEDLVVGTKIRLQTEGPGRPAIAVRFATKLPMSNPGSGLGLDTTDFSMMLIGAKTAQSLRVVGNVGMAILDDPTVAGQQNDVLLYGVSFARALTDQAEIVGELNGRASTRTGDAFPGTESKGLLNIGGRYTQGSARLDASLFFGLTPASPTIGIAVGMTYVFHAFNVP